MDNRKEKVRIILVDLVMLVIVAIACYLLLKHPQSVWKNIYSSVIVIGIPAIFYVTANKVVTDKYGLDDMDDEETEELLSENVIGNTYEDFPARLEDAQLADEAHEEESAERKNL